MEKHKNAILLDVDGVLVPFGPAPTEWSRWVDHPEREELLLSLDMIQQISDLNADIYWLTSWEDTANQIICPLIGWPVLPVFRQKRQTRRWWKLNAALEFVRSARYEKVAWIDDDHDSYASEVGRELQREIAAGQIMTVCPLPHACLVPHQIASVRKYFE
jgi:hypothetical protein